MKDMSFEHQHAGVVDAAIPSPEITLQTVHDAKQVHWSVLDLILLSISSIVAFVVMLVGFTLALVAIYGLTHLQEIITSPIYSIGASLAEALALIGAIQLLGMRRKHLTAHTIGFRRLTRGWTWSALGLSLLLILVGTLASYAVIYLFKLPATNPQLSFLAPKGTTWISIALLIVLAGIVIPFAEELFFRGVLFKFLREHWNFWIAALVSSLIFAIVHGNLVVGATAFVLGLFSAFAYERSGSLWASILIHAVSNTLKLLFVYAFIAATVKIPLF